MGVFVQGAQVPFLVPWEGGGLHPSTRLGSTEAWPSGTQQGALA